MDFGFEGKVALVTGAGSGIGKGTAHLFARDGALVIAADINMQSAMDTAAEIVSAGGTALATTVDIADSASVSAMVGYTMSSFGRIDFAFNNAGIAHLAMGVHDLDEQQWKTVLDVNLTGTFHCMKYELEVMRAQRFGVIVNTASAAALLPPAKLGAYVASKFGIIGLTKVAALENADIGIRVNAICPGWTRSGLTDQQMQGGVGVTSITGRTAEADDIGATVLFLCSPGASFINGQAIGIDGGSTAGRALPPA